MKPEELKLVLNALKWCHGGEPCGTAEAIDVVERALAQRTWVGLTREQFQKCVDGLEDLEDCWMAIETELKRNNGFAEEKNA